MANKIIAPIELMYYLYFGYTAAQYPRLLKNEAILEVCLEAEHKCKSRNIDITAKNVINILCEGLK